MSYVDFVVPSYLVKMNDMTEIPAYDQIGARDGGSCDLRCII
jgi:hypothetical protein